MPKSTDSREEENVEKEELIELRETNAALKILSDFKKRDPNAFSGYSIVEKAISLLADAKKHGKDIAMRSERILEDLHNRALYALKSRYSAFIMTEEDAVIKVTLNIGSHLTLTIARLDRLLELMVQSASQGLQGRLKPYRVQVLQLAIDGLKELITAIRKLVALEEKLKREI